MKRIIEIWNLIYFAVIALYPVVVVVTTLVEQREPTMTEIFLTIICVGARIELKVERRAEDYEGLDIKGSDTIRVTKTDDNWG